MKRKASITNSEEFIPPTTKKLDEINSSDTKSNDAEFESTLTRDNDFDDYADRIFSYLGEACTQQSMTNSSSLLPEGHLHQINSSCPSIIPNKSSEKEMKPFVCTFCPYITRHVQEFQVHVAKHTEKNFRCLLCNCMYKYRRDCVTHMKRKHSNTVTGSISQYIQKINDTTKNHHYIQPSSSTPTNNSNSLVEPKRYGCPYCSLMTKSTSSIYKHQSRKHASFPKIVHKYSTEDPNTRNLVAILKQKSIKKPSIDETDLPNLSIVSSSSSSFVNHSNTESISLVNRHRCAASKHITAHNIHSSNGRLSKLFQCCLCSYRAHHRSNVVRHVKKIHSIDFDESNLSPILNHNQTTYQSNENNLFESINSTDEHREQTPNYSFNTTVQAPLILNETNQSTKPYADIHLSINIFLPKKFQQNSICEQIINECNNHANKINMTDSDDDLSDEDELTKIHITSSSSPLPSSSQCNSLYKPHKCRRCFYRSNWKTDMLHHIRLKHHIDYANKSDYISMDSESALRSFSTYENTFGKVLKNRLLLPKIEYTDCTWNEFKSKLLLTDDQTTNNNDQHASSMINEDKNLSIDNNQQMFEINVK